MKKTIKRIGAIALSCMTIFCATSCKMEDRFIEDGDFIYYRTRGYEDEVCYAIVGTTEQGFKENVYVPTHYKGREIKFTNYYKAGYMGGAENYALELKNCRNLYFTYLIHFPHMLGSSFIGSPENIYFINDGDTKFSIDFIWGTILGLESTTAYVSSFAYDKLKRYTSSEYNPEMFHEVGNSKYIFNGNLGSTLVERIFIKANVSYMFNYENSPNNDYFFINDFERGGLIENTPYEPIREGYTFGGWYKEPECIHKWNFATDKLPKAEYDENGYVVDFVETKLYAKWIKE